MKPVVLDQVSKSYRGVQALDDVSLSVGEGEIIGLLGHNGAGKTTTMKLILGVIAATRGEVLLFGESPIGEAAKRLRASVGYLPESVRFYEQLTGREVLAFFGKLKGVASPARDALLEQVGLAHAANRRVKTYSKGMCQRLGLAQALLGHPKLLLLDEPTVGLDPTASGEFYQNLDTLRSEGTTVLLSSHVLPGIERHIDRAAILGGGRLLAAGTLPALSQQARLPLTVRVQGQCSSAGWQEKLAQQGAEFTHLNGTRLEFTSPIGSKLEVMRLLLAEPGVSDVEITAPTLDHLYAHYSQQCAEEPLS
jgi:Cu-processing system ATP-binding protein